LDALAQVAERMGDDLAEKRAAVALRRGWFAERTGDYPSALASAQRVLEWTQDQQQLADAHALWGQALWRQGNAAAAIPQVEESLRLARAIGDQVSEARALDFLGILELNLGNP